MTEKYVDFRGHACDHPSPTDKHPPYYYAHIKHGASSYESPSLWSPGTTVVMARLWVVALLLCAAAVTQQSNLLGAPVRIDANSDEAKQFVKFAVYEYNKRSNDMYEARPVEVLKAQRQLVSGFLYGFDVIIGRTQCKKPTADIERCQFHTNPEFEKTSTCHFEVYTIPWTAKSELKKATCN